MPFEKFIPATEGDGRYILINYDLDWEDVKPVSIFIENNMEGKIIEKLDGPDVRDWRIVVNGHLILIEFTDETALRIFGKDDTSNKIILDIYKLLKNKWDK